MLDPRFIYGVRKIVYMLRELCRSERLPGLLALGYAALLLPAWFSFAVAIIEIVVRSAAAVSKLQNLYNPADIIPIYMKLSPEEANPNEHVMFFAIANNRGSGGNFSSNVLILRFYEEFGNFSLHQSLPAYAPYRLEAFNGVNKDKQAVEFLAIAGYGEGGSRLLTAVSIYTIGPKPTYIFTPMQTIQAQDVRAMTSFQAGGSTYLAVGSYSMVTTGGPVYASDSQISIYKYDPLTNYFHSQSSLPASGVTDLASFSINSKVYMAVANYRDNEGNLDLVSYVYTFNPVRQQFEMLQFIATHGASDVEYFLLSDQPYLVIANEATGTVNMKSFDAVSEVYKLNNGMFELVQTLPTYGALTWKSIPLANCKHDVLLVYGDQRDNADQVGLFSFSHEQEGFKVVPLTLFSAESFNSSFRPNPTALGTFQVLDQVTGEYSVYLIIGSTNNGLGGAIYQLSYEVRKTDSPLDGFIREVAETVRTLNDSLINLQKLLTDTKRRLDDAVSLNDFDDTNGTKIFWSLQTRKAIVDTLQISSPSGSILLMRNGSLYRADPDIIQANVYVDDLESLANTSDQLSKNLAVQKELILNCKSSYFYNSKIHFASVDTEICSILGDFSIVTTVNGVSLTELASNIVKADSNSTLNGRKIFRSTNFFQSDLSVNGLVNGINVDMDAVVQGVDQTVTGKISFANNTTINGKLTANLINGINISDILLTNATEDISGRVSFASDIEAAIAVVENGEVNGLNLQSLFANRVSKTYTQEIMGRKAIYGIVRSLEAAHISSINGFNISYLDSLSLQKSKELVIGGTIGFLSEVRIDGDVDGASYVKEQLFSDKFLRKSTHQRIAGLKNMTRALQVRANAIVNGSVDGLQTIDLVILTSSNAITGSKAFKSLNAKDIFLDPNATINSMNVSNFVRHLVRLDSDDDIPFLAFAGDVKINFSQTKYLLNNDTADSLKKLLSESLMVYGNQTVSGSKTFPGDIVFNSLASSTVNSYRIRESFMSVSGNDIIEALYIFESPVTFRKPIDIAGAIDGIDVRNLASQVVTLNGSHEIFGRCVFFGNLTSRVSVRSSGLVNGINISQDIITLNTDQTIVGRKYIEAISTYGSDLGIAKDLEVGTTIDGVYLSQLPALTISLSKDETITGALSFGSDAEDRFVRPLDLINIKKDAVTKSDEQEITSEKDFSNLYLIGGLETNSTIDGVDVSEFYKELQTSNAFELFSNVTMRNVHVQGSLIVRSFVNHVNMSTFAQGFISRSGYVSLERLMVSNNLTASNLSVILLNGVGLDSDVVYRTIEQNVSGLKTMLQGAKAVNVKTQNVVDGVLLDELIQSALFVDKDQSVGGALMFIEDLNVVGDIFPLGLTDGINLSSWYLVKTDGSRQFVEGSKHFAAQVFMESVDIEQYVNKVNFYEFLSQVVHLNSNDTIAGHLEFLNGIASTSAFNVVGNLRIISNMVNDVDLLRLFQEVLLVNGSQDIPGLLINGEMSMNDLRAFGLINGLNFSTDLVTRQGHQTLSGKKTFWNLTSNHTDVYGHVNGINVTELVATSLISTSTTEQVFSAAKTFSSLRTSTADVSGTVDGLLLLPGKFVTVTTNQTITGNWTFVRNLEVDGDMIVNGKLDGVDLHWFSRNRVSLSANQTIYSPVLFQGDVQVNGDLIISGTVNMIDLSEWSSQAPANQTTLLGKRDYVNGTLNRQCQALSYVRKSVSASPYRFDQLSDYQLWSNISSQYMDYFEIGGEKYLAIVLLPDAWHLCSTTVILKRNASTAQFEFYQDLQTVGTQKVVSFVTSWNATYLLTVNSNQSCSSTSGWSSLLVWSPTSASFQVQHVLNDSAATDGSVSIYQGIAYVFLSTTTARSHAWALHMYGLTTLSNLTLQTSSSTVGSFIYFSRLFYALAWQTGTSTSRGYVTISTIKSQASSILQQIPTVGASSITSFTSYGRFYMVIANREDRSIDGSSSYDVNMEIYNYVNETSSFVWFQSISSSPSIHVEAFTIGNTVYLASTRVDEQLVIYEFWLEVGFIEIYRMPVTKAQSSKFFKADSDFYLAISAGGTVTKSTRMGSSKLLKLQASGAASELLREIALQC